MVRQQPHSVSSVKSRDIRDVFFSSRVLRVPKKRLPFWDSLQLKPSKVIFLEQDRYHGNSSHDHGNEGKFLCLFVVEGKDLFHNQSVLGFKIERVFSFSSGLEQDRYHGDGSHNNGNKGKFLCLFVVEGEDLFHNQEFF